MWPVAHFCSSRPCLVFNSAKIGTILHFLGPSGQFLGLFPGSKTVLGPTYVDNQLWFWKYSYIILFFIRPLSNSFRPFGDFSWPFWAIFVVGVRFKNNFETPIYKQLTLVFEKYPYIFVLSSAKVWSFFAFLGLSGLL